MVEHNQDDLFGAFSKRDPAPKPKKPVGKKAPARLFDINQALAAVDMNNGDWFLEQTPEARKQFAPPVFLRWAATIEHRSPDEIAYMLQSINNVVNVDLWELGDHPELIFRLAASCGLGYQRRPAWIKGPEKKSMTSKVHGFIARCYPGANESEIELILSKHDKTSFTEFVLYESGCPDAETKDLLKAFDKL